MLRFRRGFTLIELLVVIAIISLLVSILLPSLKTAQSLAKRTLCAVNLRNINMAYRWYALDYDDYIIPGYRNDLVDEVSSQTMDRLFFTHYIQPYLGVEQPTLLSYSKIIQCPEHQWQSYLGSYRQNANTSYFQKFGDFEHQDRWLMHYDSGTDNAWSGGAGHNVIPELITLRHDGMANMLFMDGHIVALDDLAPAQTGYWIGED